MRAIPVVTSEEFETLEVAAAAAVLRERFRAAVEGGLCIEAALVVCIHPEIELGQATDLILRGCPPETAVRILR